MRTLLPVVTLAAALAYLGVPPAHAQSLTTPPLFVVAGESVACELANVGRNPVWVTTAVINSTGNTATSNTLFLQAGASTQTDFLVPDSGADRYYCRFDCLGAGCDLRAAIARFTSGSDVAGYPAHSSAP